MIEKMLGIGGKRPSEITIKPVSNGWIVMLPEEIQQLNLNSVMKSAVKAIQNDGNIPDPLEEQPDHSDEIEIARDESMHIFSTIDDVLSFLKYKIPSEKK